MNTNFTDTKAVYQTMRQLQKLDQYVLGEARVAVVDDDNNVIAEIWYDTTRGWWFADWTPKSAGRVE